MALFSIGIRVPEQRFFMLSFRKKTYGCKTSIGVLCASGLKLAMVFVCNLVESGLHSL